MKGGHTPGPWRWEFNSSSRNLHLVGGMPRYDLTIMDFVRWGMDGATVRLRDTKHKHLQLMHKLHERPDWIKPFEGRAHHADWCADVTHPDMRLISAAPDLLEALQSIVRSLSNQDDEGLIEHAEPMIAARAAIAKALGTA